MKIFISWSGETSKEIAKILREWLPTVIQHLNPYMSEEDIGKGRNWSSSISSELEAANFGIICLTHDNVREPWIHFEAGALSKIINDSYVSPILFNLKPSDVVGPLTQFQATSVNKIDFKRLLETINNASQDSNKLDSRILDQCFERSWSELEEKLKSIPTVELKKTPIPKEKADQNKPIEEMLVLLRNCQNILNNPERILPEEYLHHVFTNNRKLRNDIARLDKNVFMDLDMYYRKVVDVLRRSPFRLKAQNMDGGERLEIDFAEDQEFAKWYSSLERALKRMEGPLSFILSESDDLRFR